MSLLLYKGQPLNRQPLANRGICEEFATGNPLEIILPTERSYYMPIEAYRQGLALDNKTPTLHILKPATITSSPNYCLVAVLRTAATQSKTFTILLGRGPKQNGHYEFYRESTAGGVLKFWEFQNNATVTAASVAASTDAVIVINRTDTKLEMWSSLGDYSSATYASTGFTGTASVNMDIGNNYGAPATVAAERSQLFGFFAQEGIYTRDQVYALLDNPWQILRQDRRTSYFFYPQDGNQTLTQSSTFSNSNTFYSPTVSASRQLTPSLFSNSNAFYSSEIISYTNIYKLKFILSDGTTQDDIQCIDAATPSILFKTNDGTRDDIDSITV